MIKEKEEAEIDASVGDLVAWKRPVNAHASTAIYEKERRFVYSLLVIAEIDENGLATLARDCRGRTHALKSAWYILKKEYLTIHPNDILEKYLTDRNGVPFEDIEKLETWIKPLVKPEYIQEKKNETDTK